MNDLNLSALTALVRLSETGSITQTASAMALTQSAVSHKLKALEHRLGFELLVRDGRGVRLTRRAVHYVEEIAPALATLKRASTIGSASGTLTLNVAPGFATDWLAPRLNSFVSSNPSINLRITTPRGYGDLGSLEDDLYVAFLLPHQVPKDAQPLLEVEFFPVASPALIAGGLLAEASRLLDYPLLHLDGTSDWRKWLETAGVPVPDRLNGIEFQDIQVMSAATKAGQGISLGDPMTSRAGLQTGQLIRVHNHAMPAQRAYWLLNGNTPETAAKETFRDWVSAEMSRTALTS